MYYKCLKVVSSRVAVFVCIWQLRMIQFDSIVYSYIDVATIERLYLELENCAFDNNNRQKKRSSLNNTYKPVQFHNTNFVLFRLCLVLSRAYVRLIVWCFFLFFKSIECFARVKLFSFFFSFISSKFSLRITSNVHHRLYSYTQHTNYLKKLTIGIFSRICIYILWSMQ